MKKLNELNEYTIIGKIINTRGIKGEVKIFPLTSIPNRFSKLKSVLVGDKLELLEVTSVSYDGKFVYLKFKDCDNINDVLKFKEEYLYVHDDDRIELDEGTYFISDIIGCKAYNTEHSLIGSVVDVIENSVHDLYVVENESGKHLVPAIKEFIKEIDVVNKVIIIDPIEGLID